MLALSGVRTVLRSQRASPLLKNDLRFLVNQSPSIASIVTMADAGDRPSAHEDKKLAYFTRKESEYKLGKHRSNAIDLIKEQPVIEVEGMMAICDGGGGALGHPLEYIQVGNRNGEPVSCIYCGLRYKQKL